LILVSGMIGAACAEFKRKRDASAGLVRTAVDSPSKAGCALELQEAMPSIGLAVIEQPEYLGCALAYISTRFTALASQF
jgi:hypothetical protein